MAVQVDILKAEVLDEQLGRKGEAVAGLRPTVDRTLADVQERLTFRAQTYMRDEVRAPAQRSHPSFPSENGPLCSDSCMSAASPALSLDRLL